MSEHQILILLGLVLVFEFNRVDTALRQHIVMQHEVWSRQGIDVRRLIEDFKEPSIWELWPEMTWEDRFGYLFWKILLYGPVVFIIYSYFSH